MKSNTHRQTSANPGRLMFRLPSISALLATVCIAGCNNRETEKPAEASNHVASGADSSFVKLGREIIDDLLKRKPALATDLGVHTYDNQTEDVSAAGQVAASTALKGFKTRMAAVDTMSLSAINRADRDLMMISLDGAILGYDVIKGWQKDPDTYSSGVTNAAYVIMKRNFAPAADRMRSLIARERKIPGSLLEARKNLVTPPRIYTTIALQQIDGSISFFKDDVPAAFTEVKDASLLKEFKGVNDSVMVALASYKAWMQKDLLPRSTGSFAFGSDTYVKALSANEMIDVPLDQLLQIADADRMKNEAAFVATARLIDSTKSAETVHAAIERDHPAPDKLLAATQTTLDSIRQFIVDHHIITIPASEPARTFETPAVSARYDIGFNGYAWAVRNSKAGRTLQHDAARAGLAQGAKGRVHGSMVLLNDFKRVRA